MKQATISDSTKSTAKATAGRHDSSGRRLAEIGSWIVIVVALVLLTLAAGRRLRRSQNPELTWVAVRSTSAEANQSAGFVENLATPANEDATSTGFTADLTALGSELDDPSLGRQETGAGVSEAGPAEIPRSKRWRFQFSPGLTEGQYARQLDSLGIELGIFVDDVKIQYVSELAEAEYKKRSASRSDEKRVYLTWNRGDLEKADRAILANAGVAVKDHIVLHFCPAETVEQLAKLEQEYQGRKPTAIQLTVFSVERTFRGYEAYVMEQVPR